MREMQLFWSNDWEWQCLYEVKKAKMGANCGLLLASLAINKANSKMTHMSTSLQLYLEDGLNYPETCFGGSRPGTSLSNV